jgi:putative oxidoreductase
MSDQDELSKRLPPALLALRLGVFLVMLMWTLDKFLNPAHAAGVFANFYKLEGLGETVFLILGALELILLLAFVSGMYKRWTYGAVFALHAVSTLSSWSFYLGFGNLIFFAAWPMLAACFALYILRDEDTLLTIKSSPKEAAES